MFSLWDLRGFLGTFGFQKNGKWKMEHERLFLIEMHIPMGLAPFLRLRTFAYPLRAFALLRTEIPNTTEMFALQNNQTIKSTDLDAEIYVSIA